MKAQVIRWSLIVVARLVPATPIRERTVATLSEMAGSSPAMTLEM